MGWWNTSSSGSSSSGSSSRGGGGWWNNSNLLLNQPQQQQQQPQSNPIVNGLKSLAGGAVNAVKDFTQHPVQDTQRIAQGAYDTLGKGTVDLVKGGISDVPKVASDVYHTGAMVAALAQGNKAEAAKQMNLGDQQFKSSYFYNNFLKPSDSSYAHGDYASGLSKGLGAAGDAALNALVGGGGAKVAEEGAKVGLKAALKEGAAVGSKYGAAGGITQSLKNADANPTHIAENVLGGGAAGATIGGGLGAGGHAIDAALTHAIGQYDHLHYQAVQGMFDHSSGEQKQLALPAGESTKQLPATSATNPVKTTAGPNGGVMGQQPISPQTQQELVKLGQVIHSYQSEGPIARTGSKTVNPIDPNTLVSDAARAQAVRNQSVNVMESLAQDKFNEMKLARDTQVSQAQQLHRDIRANGGISPAKSPDIKGEMANVPLHLKNNNGLGADDMAAHLAVNHGHSIYGANELLDAVAGAHRTITSRLSDEELINRAHSALANGSDEMSLRYQAAANMAEKAHAKYQSLQPVVADVLHPQITPEQHAAHEAQLKDTQAQAAQERSGMTPTSKPAEPTVSHEQLVTNLKNIDPGDSPAKRIDALNQLIEHPHTPQEDKAMYIQQRQDMLPSSETPKPAENGKSAPVSTTSGKPTAKEDAPVSSAGPQLETTPPVASSSEKPTEPTLTAAGKSNKSLVERGMDKLTRGSLKGVGNPSRAAAREGNIPLAKAAQEGVANKNLRTLDARTARKEFDQLAGNLNRDEINHVIEGGSTSNPKVQAAADYFIKHRDSIGKEAVSTSVIKGQKDNYLPHVATGLDNQKTGASGNNLSKNTRFNAERQSIEHIDASGNVVKEDEYKTIGEFDKAVQALGGKAERDTGKLLEHMLTSEGHAVENAKTVDQLASAGMTDGRPALVKSTAHMDDPKYKGYVVIDNKLIHPDAVKAYQAISSSGKINNEFGALLARSNSLGKRLVTFNGMAHVMNIFKSSIGGQGLPRAVFATFAPEKGQADVRRAVGYGLSLARASKQNVFDEYGQQSGFLGKVSKFMEPLDKALFDHFGDRQGLSTYFKIEKQMLDRGLTQDEAGRIAAEAGNQVMHLVPKDQQSTTVRAAGQLALFATQFLHNTLKTGTNAIGVGLDKTLSDKAVKMQQRVAIERVGRMFGYMFLSAQAINFAATGKFTWENGNGDPLSPIWYKNGDKEYKISNHYGQLKDLYALLTHPVTEATNKLSWAPREFVQQISNRDLFTGKKIVATGDTGFTAAYDRMIHASGSLFTPAGVDLTGKPNSQPTMVQLARFAGVNSSSAAPSDPNFDPQQYAADKAIAANTQNEQNYVAAGGSKLGWMQAMKLAGNSYYDKFFQANPQLDPTSQSFQGVSRGGSGGSSSSSSGITKTSKVKTARISTGSSHKGHSSAKKIKVSSRPAKFTKSAVKVPKAKKSSISVKSLTTRKKLPV